MINLDHGYGFRLSSTSVIALPQSLLWLPDSKSLVVSDLHFEKGSAFAAKGALLPPFDTAETFNRLIAAIDALKPSLLITLGDSFHDIQAQDRLHAVDRNRLYNLSRAVPTIWIAGNHDPQVPSWLKGQRCTHFAHCGLTFTHEPTGLVAGEVAGHLHPCAQVTGTSGRTLRRRCFVSDGRTLIMPAFGAFTGGLNVRDTAFKGLFAGPPIALVVGGTVGSPQKVQAIEVRKLTGRH
jgi:uncharacterized protein